MENITREEEARLRRAEQHGQRMKEKEEKEGKNVLEDLMVQEREMSSGRNSGNIERLKPAKPKNPCGKKSKKEEQIAQEVEREVYEEDSDQTTMKRKVVGCINKEEAAVFQNFVRNKMIILVKRIWNDKNLIEPV